MILFCVCVLLAVKAVSQVGSNLVTHHDQHYAREQDKMSAAHTVSSPSSSEIRVPHWKHHSQFHNGNTVSPSAGSSCLTAHSDCCLTAL